MIIFVQTQIRFMRILFLLAIIILITATSSTSGCKSSGAKTFCDTACQKDTMKFIKNNNVLRPYVYISFKNCNADSVAWSYIGMGVNRKFELPAIRLNKDFVRCIINDTTNAWLLFNDCSTGRGFFMKMIYNKNSRSVGSLNPYAINSIDPKFSVADGLVAYTDKGNIFVEEGSTGKKAMMTFGEQLEFDFDNIHQTLDSVNITSSRIWAKFKVKDAWKEEEKNITLQ